MPARPLPPGVPRGRAEELGNRLNSAAVRLVRRIARDDGADGLTRARASALSVLVFGGPQAMGDLARAEMVTGPTMTRGVAGRVRTVLARRRASPGDRRRVVLEATPKGTRLLERARARRIRRLAAELRGIAAAELELLDRSVAVLSRLELPPTRKEKP